MKVIVNVDRDLAISCMCNHFAYYNTPVKSRKRFKAILADYVEFWGGSSRDNHRTEGVTPRIMERAEKMVAKYWTE